MAMDRKAILVDSVKKLLALKVPENEIIVNLGEVGIGAKQARLLIEEAKKQPVEEETEKKVQEDSGTVMMDVAESLATTKQETLQENESGEYHIDEIGGEFEDEEEEAGVKKKKKHRVPLIIEKKVRGQIGAFTPKPLKTSIDRLWEKGILTTVNQKLNEMKSLKEGLDKVMQKKLDQSLKSELERIRVAFESQRSLLVSQVEDSLDEKFREATYFIEQKLIEIKTSKSELAEASKIIEEERKRQKQFLMEYEETISGLGKTKNEMLSDLNSELIKAKSSVQAVVDSAEQKVRDMDERVNRALELESSIAEGLMGDAEAKVGGLVEEKTGELRFELRKSLQSIRGMKEQMEKDLREKMGFIEKERETESRKMLEEEARKIRGLRDTFEKQMKERLEKLDKLYNMLEKQVERRKK